jgi:hypothetical protein
MDNAPYKISIGTEKPAGSRVLIRKCMVQKDVMLIFIDTGNKGCAG